jgi:hypothetical protein
MKPNNVKSSHWWAYNTLFLLEHLMGPRLYNKVLGNTEKKLYSAIDEYVTQNPQPNDFKIIELQKGEYTEPVIDPRYPVVFRGAASDWPSGKKWNFDFFSKSYGDEDVAIVYNETVTHKDDQHNHTKPDKRRNVDMKLKDYIMDLKNGSKDYLRAWRILDEQPVLRKDFNYDWLEKFKPWDALNLNHYLFMGGRNTMASVHCDFSTTAYIQIEGSKKWIFYPTNQRLFLGARPRRVNWFYSDADIYNLNDPQFPLLKHATPQEIILHAGDVLYFPSLLFHQVENVTEIIAVAYKFASFRHGFKASKMLFTCFMLATKPWLIETLIPWREDTLGYKKK